MSQFKNLEDTNTDNKCCPTYRKYSFQNQSDSFLSNNISNSAVYEIIDTLENNIKTKDQLSTLSEKLIQSFITEMDTY